MQYLDLAFFVLDELIYSFDVNSRRAAAVITNAPVTCHKLKITLANLVYFPNSLTFGRTVALVDAVSLDSASVKSLPNKVFGIFSERAHKHIAVVSRLLKYLCKSARVTENVKIYRRRGLNSEFFHKIAVSKLDLRYKALA